MPNEIITDGVAVARGASYLFLDGLVRNMAGVVFLVYATKILLVSEIGALSAFSLILAFFMAMGTFALPSAVTKYVSENMGIQRTGVAKGIYSKALRFGFIVALLVLVLCLGASKPISIFVLGNSNYQSLIAILGVDAFAWLLSPFLSGALAGLQRFKEIAVAEIVGACINCGISISSLALGFGLTGVIVGWVLGDFTGLGLLFLFTASSFRSTHEDRTYPFRNLIKYSMPLYTSGILSYFSGTIDKFVLLFSIGVATLGIYNVALAATTIVGLVGGSISNALFPQFSKTYGGLGDESLKEAAQKASRYIFLIYVPMSFGLAAVSLPTIEFFIGPAYAMGWLPLTIVSLAMALTSANIIVGSLLLSVGATRAFLEANLLTVAAGAALAATLAVSFGMVGVSFARVVLMLISFLYLALRLKKVFGLRLDFGAFKKSLLASATMASGVAVIEFLLPDIHFLPLYILLGAGLYLVMLKILKAVNNEDATLLRQFLPKRLGKVVDAFARLLV